MSLVVGDSFDLAAQIPTDPPSTVPRGALGLPPTPIRALSSPSIDSRRRSTPLAASRSYYPGFFGALFLVLLRIAIGWHFLYEGLDKLDPKNPPFSSEGYLRGSVGPVAPYFRMLVPDFDSLSKMDSQQLYSTWTEHANGMARHYGFDDKQRDTALARVEEAKAVADDWFIQEENRRKLEKYRHDLEALRAAEASRDRMSFERERSNDAAKDVEKQRKEILSTIDGWTSALRGEVLKLVTDLQKADAGPYSPPWSTLDLVNLSTKWGLTIIGACLILGFFTPLAALGGAALLSTFYFSMPPWPGLPPNPMAEGHYLIVNKNLVELIACLVLASTPSGLWVGLDAIFFGRWARRSRLASADADHDRDQPDDDLVNRDYPRRRRDNESGPPIPLDQ